MTTEDYDVQTCAPRELSRTDLVTCIAIVRSGEAVDPERMRADLGSSHETANIGR